MHIHTRAIIFSSPLVFVPFVDTQLLLQLFVRRGGTLLLKIKVENITDLGSRFFKSTADAGPVPHGGAVVLARHDRGRPGAMVGWRGGSSAFQRNKRTRANQQGSGEQSKHTTGRS